MTERVSTSTVQCVNNGAEASQCQELLLERQAFVLKAISESASLQGRWDRQLSWTGL